MKSITVILTAIIAIAVAQVSPPWYDVPSSGFRLALKSDNDTLNGHVLGACHQGAAIEGLCLTGETVHDPATHYTTFFHNVSSSDKAPANANDTAGVLNWNLMAGSLTVPSAMSFIQDPGSNIADLIFSPGWTRFGLVAFEDCGTLYLPVTRDDTVTPPGYYKSTLKLQNWYICLTRYSYVYTTLNFKFGLAGEPQNPTCQSVEVNRVWV